MTDSIHINGIRAYGYTGFFQEERTLGQWFQVDLTLCKDLSKAGYSDRLEDTYDYREVVQAIQSLIQTSKFLLIERLAEAIANMLLQSGKMVQVRVKLTKLAPPIPDFSGTVAIEITRPVVSETGLTH